MTALPIAFMLATSAQRSVSGLIALANDSEVSSSSCFWNGIVLVRPSACGTVVPAGLTFNCSEFQGKEGWNAAQCDATDQQPASRADGGVPTTIKNPQRVAHRRTELIEVANKLFLERGFHNTSIRDMVRACSFNIASLHMYVSSQDDVRRPARRTWRRRQGAAQAAEAARASESILVKP